MVIGFSQRFQTVSESDGIEGDFFPIDIPVATLRPAERVHPMLFSLQLSDSTAVVEPAHDITSTLIDAVFGNRDERGENNGPIQEEFDLRHLQATIPPLPAGIINDLRFEDEECFSLRISPIDVPGYRDLFSCNEDDSRQTTYYCETTICIEDDDGRLLANFNIILHNLTIFQSHS